MTEEANGVTTEQPAGEVNVETTEVTYTKEQYDLLAQAIREEEQEKYKGIQRVVSQKDKEIQSLKTQPQNPQSGVTTGMIDLMKKQADGDPETLSNIRTLEVQLAQERQNLEAQQRQNAVLQENQAEKAKFDAKIIAAGFDPNDDLFIDVDESFEQASIVTGRFDLVERKLDRILKANKKTTAKVETEKEKEERIERQVQEKYGLNTPEKVSPSAGSARIPTKRESLAKYVKSLSTLEYAEQKDKIDAAYEKMTD